MAKVAFGTTFLGDGLVWLGVDCERLAAEARPLVWSTKADLAAGSPNFYWRIKAVVWARRTDAVALSTALENLAKALGGDKKDLKVYKDDGTTQLRKYPSCRFDGMQRSAAAREARGDFEDDVTFVFTTSSDPE